MCHNKANFRYFYLILVALLPVCLQADALSHAGGSSPMDNLIEAIKRNSTVEITAILKQNPQPHFINALHMKGQGKDHKPPLFFAIERGDANLVHLLLEKGADITTKDALGNTALHKAVQEKQFEIVRLFLNKDGVNVNVEGQNKDTPLHYAAKSGNVEIAQLLIANGATIEALSESNYTILHHAALGRSDNVKMIEFILSKKPTYLDQEDNQLETPLHKASIVGNAKTIKSLLAHGSTAINKPDKRGICPLHYAAMSGNVEAVKALLENKADSNKGDKDNDYPLHYAVRSIHKDAIAETIKMLLDGTFGEKADSTKINNQRQTALHSAVEKGLLAPVTLLIDQATPMTINARDGFGATPLYLAAKRSSFDIVKQLLEKKADVNTPDKFGTTPLHLAAQGGSLDIVKLLLEKEANVNRSDDFGTTPLHLAAQGGFLAIVKLLLEKKADSNVKDTDGYTPADYARRKNFNAILDELNVTEDAADSSPSIHAPIPPTSPIKGASSLSASGSSPEPLSTPTAPSSTAPSTPPLTATQVLARSIGTIALLSLVGYMLMKKKKPLRQEEDCTL